MILAVLGGRFDPPHIGHFLIAQQILELYPHIDQVLLVPASKHQWKETQASALQRLAMTKYLTTKRIVVSDIELQRGGISYTIDTILELKKQYNATQLYWIIGADIVPEFPKWEKAEVLTKEATFLVFPRDPYHLPTHVPPGFEIIQSTDLLITNISSTAVRKRVRSKQAITYLVPPKVADYIAKHKLYGH